MKAFKSKLLAMTGVLLLSFTHLQVTAAWEGVKIITTDIDSYVNTQNVFQNQSGEWQVNWGANNGSSYLSKTFNDQIGHGGSASWSSASVVNETIALRKNNTCFDRESEQVDSLGNRIRVLDRTSDYKTFTVEVYNASGTLLSTLTKSSFGQINCPQTLIHNGSGLVIWNGEEHDPNQPEFHTEYIKSQEFDFSQNQWNNENVITTSTYQHPVDDPSVLKSLNFATASMDADGNILLIWHSQDYFGQPNGGTSGIFFGIPYEVMSSYYTKSTKAWSAPEKINDSDVTGESVAPNLIMDSQGNAMAVWYIKASKTRLVAHRFIKGQGWGNEFQINNPETALFVVQRISTFINDYDNIMVSWQESYPDANAADGWSFRFVSRRFLSHGLPHIIRSSDGNFDGNYASIATILEPQEASASYLNDYDDYSYWEMTNNRHVVFEFPQPVNLTNINLYTDPDFTNFIPQYYRVIGHNSLTGQEVLLAEVYGTNTQNEIDISFNEMTFDYIHFEFYFDNNRQGLRINEIMMYNVNE